MKNKHIVGLAVVMLGLLGAGTAAVAGDGDRGGFVPGHVFVSDPSGLWCEYGEIYGWDQIWEIDVETGEVTLFAELAYDWCGGVTGLAFTPDGTRLRASSAVTSWILEFDAQGNVEVALDASDGISFPWGYNNIAYDAQGDFYVVNDGGNTIMRFPADGGPGSVFADAADGIWGAGPIAFAADGDLYFGNGDGGNYLVRITPQGDGSVFDDYGNDDPSALTADDAGYVYVGLENAILYQYDAGDPDSREVLVSFPFGLVYAMTMSPGHESIYVGSYNRLYAVDVTDGSVTLLADIPEGRSAGLGIAVVPSPPPGIPTLSEWGLLVMTLLLVALGTIVLRAKVRSVSTLL